MRRWILAPLAIAACSPKPIPPTPPSAIPPVAVAPVGVGAPTLDALGEGEHVRGFTARAVYTDDRGRRIGARFVHDRTGFTLDYLRIESAPQAHLWVTTFPTSDKGEPHTQEHLLLGKGNRGRRLGSNEAMALVTSNAYTAQWRTSYTLYTVAGPSAFWGALADHLDALLNPDYTDEEIRREVRNFGVDKAPGGGMRLEEKGTVYNEMVGYYEDPEAPASRALHQMVYGPKHPLALESGGYPAALREITPADIRAFHTAHYHLANMGMIGAYPSAMTLDDVLVHTGAILDHAAGRTGKVVTMVDLPPPSPAPAGSGAVVDYPYGDAANPSPIALGWPATRSLDLTERTLAGLFLDAFAGDASTPLYQKLIDSKTRVLDLGATGVSASISSDEGQPIELWLAGVRADKLDAKTLADVRGVIAGTLDHLAKLPDGDPELVAFDREVESRVVLLRRQLAKLLDTPPGFGERNEDSTWLDHLDALWSAPGFSKSLTLEPQLRAIEAVLAQPANPWRTRIHAWGLDAVPYAVAAKPSPALRKSLDAEREQRIAKELARLQGVYGTKDAAATLARYAADYDQKTHELEASQQAAQLPPLVASPPMTLDDSLQYDTGEIGSARSFVAHFPSMSSVRVELLFDTSAVANDQIFLAALPALLGDAGVIDNGKPRSAAEVQERERREILELSVGYATNRRTHRVELSVAGSGLGQTEARAALGWMKLVMLTPDWRPDNLPRLRDLLAQEETELRQVMLGYGEHWMDNPRDAWADENARESHALAILTRLHDLHRLRWMFADPGDRAATAATAKFLTALAGATLSRAQYADVAAALADGRVAAAKSAAARHFAQLAAALPPKAQALAQLAGKDLAVALADLPDHALSGDWAAFCREMAADLGVGSHTALARLEKVRAAVIDAQLARVVEVGSAENERGIAGDVEALVRAVPSVALAPAGGVAGPPPFSARLRQRDAMAAQNTRFVGLVDPNLAMGLFVNLAPATWYGDNTDDAVLDYLASNLYTGHGGHTVYAKTWAAGLAYSNGVHPFVHDGLLDYSAERCPLLSQTIRFVVTMLRAQKPDANIARYAIAKAFDSRIADPYERRADAMAADLVDGMPPDLVRAFRSRVLDLAKRPDLADVLFARMPKVYGKVLPGLATLDPRATYFVIGPEKQLAAYEAYLREAIGTTAKLVRLYPRDFWLTGG